MPWAEPIIARLRAGERVRLRPRGNSMTPRIRSGEAIALAPCEGEPRPGDAVLCRVRGSCYVHLVKAIQGHGDARRFLIGNNHGGLNGWIPRRLIFGVVVAVGEAAVAELLGDESQREK